MIPSPKKRYLSGPEQCGQLFSEAQRKNSIGWLHVNVNFPTWKFSNVEFRLVFLNLQSRRWRTWNVALIGLRWGMVVCDQIMWACYLISFETTIYQPPGGEREETAIRFSFFWVCGWVRVGRVVFFPSFSFGCHQDWSASPLSSYMLEDLEDNFSIDLYWFPRVNA